MIKPIKISGVFSDNVVEYQSKGNRDRSISIARYLNNIRVHLRKLINDKKKNGEWKIQLIMKLILYLLEILLKVEICIVSLIVLKL